MNTTESLFSKINPADFAADVRFERSVSTAPHSSYDFERYLCHLVAEGDLDSFDELVRESELSGAFLTMGNLSSDPLRQMQYFTVAAMTLVSRTAISAGMEEGAAYEMSDITIQRADRCRNTEEIANLLLSSVREYIDAVRQIRHSYVDNTHVRAVTLYVDQHIHEKFSLEEMAAELSLDKSYLCRLFKKETGMTVGEYFAAKKTEQAKSLLLKDEYSLSEIASFLGYSTQSHFIQMFKKYTGMTPGKWRQETRIPG